MTRRSWPIEAVVGVVGTIPWAWHRGFNSTKNQFGFGFKLASKRPRFPPRSDHDRVMIGSRLWVNRDPRSPSVVVLIEWRRFRNFSSTIAARSRRDRGLIGPRSWSSSTCLHSRPIALQVRGRFDRDREPQLITAVRSDQVRWAVRSRDQALPPSASI